MSDTQKNNPLHGLTLETILNQLIDHYGWDKLGQIIDIKCFKQDPGTKSSFNFLLTTPWARTRTEELYLRTIASL